MSVYKTDVEESTIQGILKSYQEVHVRKQRLADDIDLLLFPAKKQGKPLLGVMWNKF